MTTSILIADDSLFARMLAKEAVSHIIKDAHYIETTSGAETLAKAAELGYAIDWYLLDINMGGPDGIDTAQQLLNHGVSGQQLALVTGNRSQALQQEAEQMGIAYINKTINPADADQFIERLRHFFQPHSLHYNKAESP